MPANALLAGVAGAAPGPARQPLHKTLPAKRLLLGSGAGPPMPRGTPANRARGQARPGPARKPNGPAARRFPAKAEGAQHKRDTTRK
jgi:hypothetical protein